MFASNDGRTVLEWRAVPNKLPGSALLHTGAPRHFDAIRLPSRRFEVAAAHRFHPAEMNLPRKLTREIARGHTNAFVPRQPGDCEAKFSEASP